MRAAALPIKRNRTRSDGAPRVAASQWSPLGRNSLAVLLAAWLVATPWIGRAGESGACCHEDGDCTQVSSAVCTSTGGYYQGDGLTCQEIAGCANLGQCCFADRACVVSAAETCFASLGGSLWTPGIRCDATCPAYGACCAPDGTCSQDFDVICAVVIGGTFHGQGASCEPSPCLVACPCPADLNADGLLNGADVRPIVDCVLQAGIGGPPGEGCLCVDMDGDGTIEATDVTGCVAGLLSDSACR